METNSGPLEVRQPEGGPTVTLEGKEVTAAPLPTAEELLAEANRIGGELRALIVKAKRLPKATGLEPHQDSSKCLAIAQADLQTGFMWLRRAIEQPKVF